ncbi:MAG: lipopolysaccharide biosynthesis protein [Hydrogenophaga sp.]|uniref:lipopolysaccharide biosynthesis protein n=1 Tax=Hydrogenophaga sp. TaxID=1904254 RepID=UPI002736C660|nr:lipopolysaccharide biosynthesis protein [Hydrogenophaga sp.]MDP3350557.1 lipopolysaccharide biosynthesis protein [Hydrogenophaga sp.]MDP3626856.1 lipopolysaccharide biosynthesis protein [Hydrogenophaga sp.]
MIDGIGRRVAQGVKWTVIYKVTGQLINWVSTLWVVRMLSPSDYGLNAMMEVPLDFAMAFVTWGMFQALIQKETLERKELSAVFGFMLGLNLIAFSIFQICAKDIAEYFREPNLEDLIRIISLVFLMVPFRIIPNALLDQKLQFKVRAQVDLAASTSGATTAVILAILGAGVWALVASVLVNYLLRAVVLAIIQPWFVLPSMNVREAKAILMLGTKVLVSGILIIATGKMIEIVVGPVIGAEKLGIFAVAAQLAMLPVSRVLPIINQTLYPAFVHINSDRERIREFFIKSLQYAGLIIVPAAVGLYMTSDLVIDLFFGERWNDLKIVMPILLLMLPVALIRNLLTSNLVALGKSNLQIILHGVVLILTAILCWVFREDGLHGLIWITVLAMVFSSILVYAVSSSIFGINLKDIVRSMFPSILSSVAMGGVLYVLGFAISEFSQIVKLAAMITIGMGFYSVFLRIAYTRIFSEIISVLREKQ